MRSQKYCSNNRKKESGKKPYTTTPKAIRLVTISNLLEKQTTQMNKIGQMVQPLQKAAKISGDTN
jgi:hypothetical protein